MQSVGKLLKVSVFELRILLQTDRVLCTHGCSLCKDPNQVGRSPITASEEHESLMLLFLTAGSL